MKNALVLILGFLCAGYMCPAQAYHPFLNESAHWTIEEYYCSGRDCENQPTTLSDFCHGTNTFSFKIDGDTIIDSRIYKKLRQKIVTTGISGQYRSCDPVGSFGFVNCGTVGILWEDTLGGYFGRILWLGKFSLKKPDLSVPQAV